MATESEPPPTLVLNPPDDEAFRSYAMGLVEGGVITPTTLEDGLRQRYPAAIVRRRELAGERAQIWYVYRDGRWIRPAADRREQRPGRTGRHDGQKTEHG